MALSTTTARRVLNGDAATLAFAFPYKYIAASQLRVFVYDTDDDSIDEQTLNVDFTVSATASATNGVYPGATITFSTAPGADKKVIIFRDPALTQEFDFDAEADPLPVLTRSADFDAMRFQAVNDIKSRALRLPDGDYQSFNDLPTKAELAGLFLAFDSSGDPIASSGDIGSVAVSTLGEAIVAATSTANAAAIINTRQVINVKNTTYGATGDGVTDDTDAVQAAIDACTAGGIVYFPPGTYVISSILDIGDGTSSIASTKQNIMLMGDTVPNGELSANIHATRLKYTGSSGDAAILRLNGPLSCAVIGLTLDCNFLANGGIYAKHIYRSRIQDIYVGNYRGSAYKIEAYVTHSATTTGATNNIWENIHCAEPGTSTCTSFECGIAAATPGQLDVARNIIRIFSFKCGNNANSTGILLRFCDLITFENGLVHCGVAATSANAKLLKIVAPTGNTTFPMGIIFRNVLIAGDYVTNYSIDGSWTNSAATDGGVLFVPFIKQDVESCTNIYPTDARFRGFTEEFRFFSEIRTRSGGIGYNTGAGGVVTQLTNRSTGVQVDKICGAITTDTTSLAAEAAAIFTVTNSTVAATDCVVLSVKSGSNGGNTAVTVNAVAAGSFDIKVSNNNAAAGTAETGAIVINFAVIKAVAA